MKVNLEYNVLYSAQFSKRTEQTVPINVNESSVSYGSLYSSDNILLSSGLTLVAFPKPFQNKNEINLLSPLL